MLPIAWDEKFSALEQVRKSLGEQSAGKCASLQYFGVKKISSSKSFKMERRGVIRVVPNWDKRTLKSKQETVYAHYFLLFTIVDFAGMSTVQNSPASERARI